MALGTSYITPVDLGCTDPQAYNCADDVWIDGEDYPYYTFLVGTTPYINGCNYDNTDDYEPDLPVPQGGCESGPCEGYYNPGATTDDGSCDYYQAPDQDDITFTVSDTGILVDWSAFSPPSNAIISGYNVSRCTAGCSLLPVVPFHGEMVEILIQKPQLMMNLIGRLN